METGPLDGYNPSRHTHLGPTWAIDGHGGLCGPWVRCGQIHKPVVGLTWAAHAFLNMKYFACKLSISPIKASENLWYNVALLEHL